MQARQREGPPAFKGLLKDAKNHELWIASFSDGGMMLFCSKSCHYASPHPRLLANECRGKVDIHRSSKEFYLNAICTQLASSIFICLSVLPD